VKRESRSKAERIKLKMGAAQAEEVEAKKDTCGARKWGNGRILLLCKSILLFFARAGFNSVYLFFLY
jgi:hypothetical protein